MPRIMLVIGFGLLAALAAATPVDYSLSTHWSATVLLQQPLTRPLLIGDLVLVVDGSGAVCRIDATDPVAPQVLPPLDLPWPARRLAGRHADYLYVAGVDSLMVVAEDNLAHVATLPFPDVQDLRLGLDLAAVLTGESLVMVDAADPVLLPRLGEVALVENWGSGYQYVDLFGDLVLISGSATPEGVLIVDAADPAGPQIVGRFGEPYTPEPGRSIIEDRRTVCAFVAGAVYTMEYYYFHDSGSGTTTRDGWLQRWDLGDVAAPQMVAETRPLAARSHAVSAHMALHEEKMHWAIGPCDVVLDLGGDEVTPGVLEASVGQVTDHTYGLAVNDDLVVYAGTYGQLHLFRHRDPEGFPPPAWAGRSTHAAASAGFAAVQSGGTGLIYELPDDGASAEVVWQHYEQQAFGVALTEHWAAFDLFSALRVVDLVTLESHWLDLQLRDLAPFGSVHAAGRNGEGLVILDTSLPESFTVIAAVATSPLLAVVADREPPGGMPAAATLDGSARMTLWDLVDPSAPVAAHTLDLTGTAEDLVSIGGEGPAICAVTAETTVPRGGVTMRLILAGDDGGPEISEPVVLPGEAQQGWWQGNVLYLACDIAGLVVLDVEDSARPLRRGGLAMAGIHAVRGVGDGLWTAGALPTMLPRDISDGYVSHHPQTTPSAPLSLHPPFPNPFNPGVDLVYTLARSGQVRLRILDIAGRELLVMGDGYRGEGTHRLHWNGRDGAGRALPSGVYLVEIESGGWTESSKLTLVR